VSGAQAAMPEPVNLGGWLHPPFTLSVVAAHRSD
jgi:hypothetical protein